MGQRFFGHPESPLFGVYHRPRDRFAQPLRAVVICPPIGHEYIRTHWSLRLLANQLVRRGVHMLRMDYQGIGDSRGDVQDVQSLSQWTDNIEAAIEHLQVESGAGTVMLMGQRIGAALAAILARQNSDVNSVVLWDPVVDGMDYLAEMRAMHAQMIDGRVCKMKTRRDDQFEEILGSLYSRSLVSEIESLRIDVGSIQQPQLIVDESKKGQYTHPEPSLIRVIRPQNVGGWSDLRVLETAGWRPQITRTLVETIDDMFARLDRWDALVKIGNLEARLS